MLVFKVFAGNMYCGNLITWTHTGHQTFFPASKNGMVNADGIVSRVANYKSLTLIRS